MARTTGTNPISDTNAEVVHLVRLKYWTGAAENEVRLASSVSDLDIDVGQGAGTETWQGSGLLLSVGSTDESTDLDTPGFDLTLDGVDQTIISIIMQNDFRGRKAECWRAWINRTTGAVVDTPIMLFDGYQNDPYTVSESMTEEPDAVSVGTRIVSRLTKLSHVRPIKSQTTSYNEMLERAGLSTGDTFFQNVPAIMDREVYWGRVPPNDFNFSDFVDQILRAPGVTSSPGGGTGFWPWYLGGGYGGG